MGFECWQLSSEGRSTDKEKKGTKEWSQFNSKWQTTQFCVSTDSFKISQGKEVTEVGSRWSVQTRGRVFFSPCNNYTNSVCVTIMSNDPSLYNKD